MEAYLRNNRFVDLLDTPGTIRSQHSFAFDPRVIRIRVFFASSIPEWQPYMPVSVWIRQLADPLWTLPDAQDKSNSDLFADIVDGIDRWFSTVDQCEAEWKVWNDRVYLLAEGDQFVISRQNLGDDVAIPVALFPRTTTLAAISEAIVSL